MSENAPKNHNRKTRAALRTSGAVLSVLGITASLATTANAIENPTHQSVSYSAELTPRTGNVAPRPETLAIPENIQKILDKDSIYIPLVGCSGMLIRDKAGNAIGFSSAAHCFNDYLKDSPDTIDGKQYLLRSSAELAVKTGTTEANQTSAGTISSIIMPKGDLRSATDLIIGSLGNNDISNVLATYAANQASTDEIAGKTLYMGGWPVDQPKATTFNRQDFAMVPIGKERDIPAGHDIGNWTAVAATKDGAICSSGNSGGQAFYVNNNGQTRYYGSLALYQPFNDMGYKGQQGGDERREIYSNVFGIDLRNPGITGICGFANYAPQINDNYNVISFAYTNNQKNNLTKNTDYIPSVANEYIDYGAYKYYSQQLLNPNVQKNILKGRVKLKTDDKKPQSWIEDPVVIVDNTLGIKLLGYADSSTDTGFKFILFDTDDQSIDVQAGIDGQVPAMHAIKARISPQAPKDGSTYGTLSAPGEQSFGHMSKNDQPDSAKYQLVYLADGSVHIAPKK